jgi:hypothetical protein
MPLSRSWMLLSGVYSLRTSDPTLASWMRLFWICFRRHLWWIQNVWRLLSRCWKCQVIAPLIQLSTIAKRLFCDLDYFLSESGYSAVIESVVAGFTLQVRLALNHLEAEVSLEAFGPALEVISTLAQHPPRVLPRKDFEGLLPDIFVLAYLLPECDPSSKDHATVTAAKAFWEDWLKTVLAGVGKEEVLASIKTKLQVLLCDTQARPLYVFLKHTSHAVY